MRHMISRLFTLILIVLMGYNAWQISLLRNEVATLKTQVVAIKTDQRAESRDSHRLSLISKAREHADFARQSILKGDFKRGSTELEKSLQLLQQAGKNATAPPAEALDKFQRTLDNTRLSIEDLWKKMGAKPSKAKGDR